MSDSNRIRVSLVEESSFGVTPATPTMLVLNTTGQSLRDRVGYQQSQTIRNDANVQDLIRLSKSSGGGIPCELTYPTVNEGLWSALRAVMRTTESAAVTNADTAAIAATGTTVTRGAGSWITDGFAVGDIVRITNASTAADNRFGKVTAVVALTLTLQLGDGAVWAGTDASVTVTRGARMTNGTTDRSFSIEVARLDVGKYQVFTGQVASTLSLTVADQAITTANLGFEGSSSVRGSSAISGATYSNPTSNAVLDSISVPSFYLGGNSYACKSFGLEVNNNVAARTQIGALGPQSMRRGSFGATGRIEAYMQTFTEMDAYADNTASDIWFALQDPSAQALAFSFPQMKWSEVGADTRGLNQDDYISGTFQAYADPTESCTMKVFRF